MSKINFIVFFVLVCISNCIGEHYQTLDISPTASIEEIKKAYKILALKYHPDKVENTEENKNMFFKISKAYKVLSNEESRKIYDLDGQDAIDQIEENKKPSDEEMDEIYSDFFNRGKQAFNDQDEELFVNTEVIKLGYDNYSKLINRNKIWLILFYNALDEKLDEIVYEWKILASKSYDLFNIAYVSCRFNQVFCDEFEIKKTPEILFYGEAGYGLKEHSKYLGKKLWKDMFTYASNSMLNYVRSIDIYNYKEFLRDNPTKYKVLLFTNKPYIPAQLKALSKKFFPNLFFGCVKNAVKNELINKENFNLDSQKFPTLMVLNNGWKYTNFKYEGEFLNDQITKFLTPFSLREISGTGKYYQMNRDIVHNKFWCGAKDDKNVCLIYILKKTLSLTESDKEELQYLANRYANDENVKVFYLFLEQFDAFYDTLRPEDEGCDMIIYKGKSGKYMAYEMLNSTVKFSHEVSGYMDNILGGFSELKPQIRPLALYSKNTNNKKKDDL